MSSFRAQTDYINENYSECLKHLVIEMKKYLASASSQLTSNTNVLQQLNAIATTNILNFTNNSTNTNASSINNNNDLVLFLLKATQNLTNWLDSIQPSKIPNDPIRFINANTSVFFNNLALVHHSIQKHSLSSLYFQKALNENTKFINKCLANDSKSNEDTKKSDENDSSLTYINMLLMNRRYELLFNLGISLLLSKQPVSAFECLYKVTKVYSQNARLWLRLAECCLMCYRHSLIPNSANDLVDLQTSSLDSSVTSSNNEKILKLSEKIKCIQRSFGTGFHHKIQFGTNLTNDLLANNLSLNELKKKTDSDSQLMAKLITFEFAYVCLRNALKLIPSNQQIFSANTNSNKNSTDLLAQLKSLSSTKLGQKQSNLTENLEDEESTSAETEFDSAAASEPTSSALNEASDANVTSNTTDPNDLASPKLKQQAHSSKHATSSFDNLLFNCVWPSKPLNLVELQNLRSSILVNIAYVSLCLKDYSNTIRYCNSLLSNDDQLNAKCPVSKGNK